MQKRKKGRSPIANNNNSPKKRALDNRGNAARKNKGANPKYNN
jgi:hypothetical protein